MDIQLSVWTDPNNRIPSNIYFELSSAGGGQRIVFPPPGQFINYTLSYLSPAGVPDSRVDLYFTGSVKTAGLIKPIHFRASNLEPRVALSVGSLGGLAWDPRQHFVGNILHPVRQTRSTGGNTERCEVSCLDGGGQEETSGDGYCCVICENADIVVKVCC